jgi:hypothetical protein
MELSKRNLKLATKFFTGDTADFDQKDDDFKNLFRAYASDINSSSIREAVTLDFLGYEQYSAKHGADGFDPTNQRQKEVKPRFFNDGIKSSIGGNFNDMTLELLEKKKHLDIICSTFIGDRLIIIVEFPFSVIESKIKQPIIDAKQGKRVVCGFSNTSFQDSPEMIIHYYDKETINKNQCFSPKTRKLFEGKYATQLFEQKELNTKSI